MNTVNMPLYRLLRKMGAEDREAEEAARLDTSTIATKQDLLELKVDLQKFIIQAMLGMTAIFAMIVGLFRVFT